VAVERVRPEETRPQRDLPHEAASWPSRLAAILLAAGWFGQGIGPERAGTQRTARRRLGR
jgi:hypothetical protein